MSTTAVQQHLCGRQGGRHRTLIPLSVDVWGINICDKL
jgi:hypothetical protein